MVSVDSVALVRIRFLIDDGDGLRELAKSFGRRRIKRAALIRLMVTLVLANDSLLEDRQRVKELLSQDPIKRGQFKKAVRASRQSTMLIRVRFPVDVLSLLDAARERLAPIKIDRSALIRLMIRLVLVDNLLEDRERVSTLVSEDPIKIGPHKGPRLRTSDAVSTIPLCESGGDLINVGIITSL